MNLDKFKSIQTKIDIDTDADYSKLIASLPEKKSKKPVLTVIGTVAAALLLVVGVSMWALVGRGVRNGGKAPITPADNTEVYTLTDEEITKLTIMYSKYRLALLDEFDEKDPLSEDDIVQYLKDTNHDIIYESLTREEFSQFAKDLFNYDISIPEDITDVVPSLSQSRSDAIPVSASVTDGVATIVYDRIAISETVKIKLDDQNGLDYFVSISRKPMSKVAMIDRTKNALENLYMEYYMYELADFDEQHPLTVEQILKFCEYSNWHAYDFDFTREEFSEFAKLRFNYDMTIPEDLHFDYDTITHYEVFAPTAVSMTIKDEKTTAVFEYANYRETVCYKYKDGDPLAIDYIVSYKTEIFDEVTPQNTIKEPTTMEEVAKAYHFNRIHPFEKDTLPSYVRYHVAAFIDDDKLIQTSNKKGGYFLGIPYDDYAETVMRLYGKNDMEGVTPIEFEEQTGYLKYADLVRMNNGDIYVALEIGGGMYDCEYEILDTQYKDGVVTVKFKAVETGVDYGDGQPDTVTLTYLSDDGLIPKQFISCMIATSVPLAK